MLAKLLSSWLFTKEEHQPTIEDTYRVQLVVDDESCLLHIADTSGMEEYSLLLENHIRRADGFLCSIRSPQSTTMLVGNESGKSEGDRKVNNRLGEACTEQYAIPFFTMSARKEILFCTFTCLGLTTHMYSNEAFYNRLEDKHLNIWIFPFTEFL